MNRIEMKPKGVKERIIVIVWLPKHVWSRCLSFLHNLDYEHTNGIFANIYSTTDVNNANAAPKMPKTMGK